MFVTMSSIFNFRVEIDGNIILLIIIKRPKINTITVQVLDGGFECAFKSTPIIYSPLYGAIKL